MAGESATQTQINALGERFDKGISEIKTMLTGFDERLRGLETREAGCAPMMVARMNAAWARIDAHDAELSKLKDAIFSVNRSTSQLEAISKWILGIFTVVLTALILAVLTGKILIVLQ